MGFKRLKVTGTMFFLADTLQEEEGGGKGARGACGERIFAAICQTPSFHEFHGIPVISELCLWLRQWLIQVLFLTLPHTSVRPTWNHLPFFPYSEGHRCLLRNTTEVPVLLLPYRTNFSMCFQLAQKAQVTQTVSHRSNWDKLFISLTRRNPKLLW